MQRKADYNSYFKTINEAQGLVETVFSVTGVKDRQGDIVVPGAFRKALAGRKPTVVFSHKWDDIGQVLGSVKEWSEYMPGDGRLPADIYSAGYGGAWARVQFNLKTEAGRTAFALVQAGDLKEWSWAFDIDDGGSDYDAAKQVRTIKSVKEIYELTLCVIGANQLTQTTSAKSPALAAKEAYLVRKAIEEIDTLERGRPSAELRTILATARVLLGDENSDRKQWERIFNYMRTLDGR